MWPSLLCSRTRSSCESSPRMARLPSVAAEKRLDSSQRNKTTSRGRFGVKPSSRIERTVSIAARMPTIPSKLPPSGTLSPCEPNMTAGRLSSAPCTWPMTLPNASSRSSMPASRISPIKYERPRQSASVNANRLIPRPGAVISFRAASCCKRCLEIMSPPSFSLSITLIES